MRFAAIMSAIWRDKLALAAQIFLLLLLLLAVFGERLAPYDINTLVRDDGGRVMMLQAPSRDFPMGTTDLGRDVLSQILVGTRSVLLVGFWAAIIATGVGALLGLFAGYLRGRTDTVISRLVEISYSIPFEPLAIVLVSIISPTTGTIILAISLVFWRQPTRVIRNQVTTMRDGAFVKAARVAGASRRWIIFRHMAPLTLPIAFVYIPVAFGNAILAEASISFLGFGDPNSVSWGGILRKAFDGGALDRAWWWVVAPGVAITLATAAMFFVTRPFEEVLNPRLRES